MPGREGKARRPMRVAVRCSACGGPIGRSHRFCPHCGAAVDTNAPSTAVGAGPSLQVAGRQAEDLVEERRLVTILFADLSGSTALAERLDPEDLRRILASYFSTLSRQIRVLGGTVDKYIGDAVMAVFGAPVAHEDDAERAVRSGLAMQRAMIKLNDDLEREHGVRLRLRVGINTGEVVAGLLAGEVQSAYTVVGDAVNVAQRLESAAQSGDVLIGAMTHRLVKEVFEVETLPPVTVKGKTDPVAAYRVLRSRDEMEEAPEAGPLVGRQRELALLGEALIEAARGHGRAVCISGEPGVGKSRLVRELTARVGATVRVLLARSSSFESDTPYALVARLIRRAFGMRAGEDEGSARTAIAQGFDAVEQPLDEMSITLLLEVLGYGQRSTLDPEAKRRILVSLIRQLLARHAERGRLVAVVEDLHWADAASVSVLAQVVPDLAGVPCLFIATGRPEWEPAWPSLRIEVAPLGDAEAQALVGGLLGGAAEPSLASAILARTGGNPFFTEEVVRSLKESGSIAQSDGTWKVQGRIDLKVPETVQEVLIARLDRIHTKSRRTLQTAAIVGRTFDDRILARVAPTRALASDLDFLEKQGFIELRFARPVRIYVFRHALIQDVAYNTQLLAQRRKLHAAVGLAIEALHPDRPHEFVNELAFHYGRSDDDEKAVRWLSQAGDRAKSLYANEEALAFYRSTLEHLRDGQGPIEASPILERIGDVQTVIARYDDALASLRAAAERPVPDPVVAARLLRKVGTVLALKGAYSEALRALDEASAALGAENDLEAARIGVRTGEVLSRSGNYSRAREVLSRAVEIAESLGADEVTAEGLHYLAGVLGRTGELKAAVSLYLRCLATYERLQDMNGAARVHLNVGGVYLSMGRFEEALAELRSALSLAERMGNRWLVAGCHHNIGEVHSTRGDPKEAIASRQRALDILTAIGSKSETALALMDMGLDRVRIGQVTQGRADLLQAEALLTAVGSVRYHPSLYRNLAYAELAAGDLDAATRAAERSLEYARAGKMPQAEAMTQRALGEIAIARGDLAAARSLLEASRDRLAELGEAAELTRTEALLSRLAEHEPTSAR